MEAVFGGSVGGCGAVSCLEMTGGSLANTSCRMKSNSTTLLRYRVTDLVKNR